MGLVGAFHPLFFLLKAGFPASDNSIIVAFCKLVKQNICIKKGFLFDMSTIGDRFANIRRESGLSAKAFAESIGMVSTTVSNIEAGKREPSKDVLIKLASVYGVNLHWMLTGEGDSKERPSAGISESIRKLGNPGIQFPTIESAKFNMLPDEDKEDFPNSQESVAIFKFRAGKTVAIKAEETDPAGMVLLPVYGQRASAGPGQEATQLEDVEDRIPVVFEMLGGAMPRHCGIVRVVGDSMTDMGLFDGDLAIFDQSRQDGDGVFVISIGGAVRIKRLEYRPFERKLIVSSENSKRYPHPEVIGYEQANELLRVHGKVICWMHRHPY